MARQSTNPPRPGWLPRNTFSATVRLGTTIECWNTVAIRPRHPRHPAVSDGADWPSKRTDTSDQRGCAESS
jgi:hypothetical protein